jgi:hypothetical protein
MKRLSFLLFFLLIHQAGLYSQDNQIPSATPYFSAVIVNNIEISSSWYQSLFGLEIKNIMNDSVGNYKIVILKSHNSLLELLELKGSLDRKNCWKITQMTLRSGVILNLDSV